MYTHKSITIYICDTSNRCYTHTYIYIHKKFQVLYIYTHNDLYMYIYIYIYKHFVIDVYTGLAVLAAVYIYLYVYGCRMYTCVRVHISEYLFKYTHTC